MPIIRLGKGLVGVPSLKPLCPLPLNCRRGGRAGHVKAAANGNGGNSRSGSSGSHGAAAGLAAWAAAVAAAGAAAWNDGSDDGGGETQLAAATMGACSSKTQSKGNTSRRRSDRHLI